MVARSSLRQLMWHAEVVGLIAPLRLVLDARTTGAQMTTTVSGRMTVVVMTAVAVRMIRGAAAMTVAIAKMTDPTAMTGVMVANIGAHVAVMMMLGVMMVVAAVGAHPPLLWM